MLRLVFIGLLLSYTLLMTACGSNPPPCNREDVKDNPDGSRTINEQCWQRILGDLDAFDKASR
jgi:hypothetical protein